MPMENVGKWYYNDSTMNIYQMKKERERKKKKQRWSEECDIDDYRCEYIANNWVWEMVNGINENSMKITYLSTHLIVNLFSRFSIAVVKFKI